MSLIHDFIEIKRSVGTKIYTSFCRLLLNDLGKRCQIYPSVIFKNHQKIRISDNCIIKEGVIIDGRSDREIGVTLGKGVTIRAYTYIDCYGYNGYIYLDDFAAIGQNVYLGGNGGIKIGKYAMVSGHTYMVSAKRIYNVKSKYPFNYQGEIRKPIVIEDNAWIAAKCVICSGVTVGKNSVIGAGSIVTKDIPPNCLAYGVPATVKKELTWKEFIKIKQDEVHQYLDTEQLEKIANDFKLTK